MSLPAGYERFDLLSDQQQDVYNTLLQNLLGQLGGKGLDTMAAPFKRQFEEEIIPGIAERFSGLGAGSQSSSAFQQALGQQGAGLAERLAALGMQQQQGALSGLQGLLGVPTQGLVQKAKPWWQEGLLGLGSGLGKGLGSALGSGGNPLSMLLSLFGK